jgi:hypothetical protein
MKSQVTITVKQSALSLMKEAGDISSVFPSLSGRAPEALAARFGDVKKQLIRGHEDAVIQSWHRLLASLKKEVADIKQKGSNVSLQYNVENPPEQTLIDRYRLYPRLSILILPMEEYRNQRWTRSRTVESSRFETCCLDKRRSN